MRLVWKRSGPQSRQDKGWEEERGECASPSGAKKLGADGLP